jgi:predicted TPR repeat methyltransferase
VRGQALYETGRTADAIALFENWLSTDTDNPVARHLLNAYRGKQQTTQCTRQYIERTFDEFANSFDNTLARLKYSCPQLVKTHLAKLKTPEANLNILDLGCGTGLIGEVLKPYARKLTGIDLSAAMLEKAAEKQLYHRLEQSDIARFLDKTDEQYDLITCMDTLIYIGKLDELFALINRRLKIGGQLLFSTEKLTEERDYQLNISGRYSHHPDYLRRVLNNACLGISGIIDVIIRNESGYPIAGQMYLASHNNANQGISDE